MGKNGTSQIAKPGSNGNSKLEKAAEKAVETLVASIPPVEKKVEKVVERVGSIPEGIFFAEGYSPRVLSESGKILAIEFLKRLGGAAPAKAPEVKDKRQLLKDQIKVQLGGSK